MEADCAETAPGLEFNRYPFTRNPSSNCVPVAGWRERKEEPVPEPGQRNPRALRRLNRPQFRNRREIAEEFSIISARLCASDGG